MKVLEPVDNPQAKYHSSISQYSNMLAVLKRGEWCPISFDVIDYIDCEEVKSHKAIVSDGDNVGYHFPVGECVLYTNEYVYHDENGVELRTLPEWFGAGFYNKALDRKAFINFDDCSLGVRNRFRLRIGLNYALAEKNLPVVE